MRVVLKSVSFVAISLSLIMATAADHKPKKKQPAVAESEDGRQAPLLEGLGQFQRKVSTDLPQAQRYFNQGLVLAYGFNHAEAERAFREAARLDPQCAIAWWGVALVLGPNINANMASEAVPQAHAAAQKAMELKEHASPPEQALISALAQRYTAEPVEDRTALNEAYASAMREVVKQYPDDLDAATLLAEALMDLHPWDYWQRTGDPQPWTGEIVELLENVIERDPEHPGANHYYIHAVEASNQPELGIPAADRLRTLVPGAGHLVHMPSHIYIRTGRYQDATIANEKAIEADDQYVAQCHAQGLYSLAYMSHNHHFLSAAAAFEGRSQQAIDAAREMAARQDHDMLQEEGMATMQHYAIWPLYVLVRFGHWDEILSAPRPELPYPTGVWHYARGMALTRKGRLDEASQELAELVKIAGTPELEKVLIWETNSTADLLKIASQVVAGELASARGDHQLAIGSLMEAGDLEDALRYDEPATWHSPVRETLGAILLEAGKPQEAEAVYLDDLRRYPENGFSLFGLSKSLEAQGRDDEAKRVWRRFEKAWQRADVKLIASRF